MAISAIYATERRFKVTYNEVETIRGELYQYAERYLGTKDVIVANETYYELGEVKPSTPKKNVASSSSTSTSAEEQPKEHKIISKQLPLNEEALMAANLAKKAESVAKQIYRIRETRMNILSGDVEHMPADGNAMELVLKELNKQEKALTSMFVGTKIVRPMKRYIYIELNDSALAEQQVLFTFSHKQGILDAADKNGEPVYVKITRYSHPVLAAEQPKKKNSEPIYENEIYRSITNIIYRNKSIYEKIVNL